MHGALAELYTYLWVVCVHLQKMPHIKPLSIVSKVLPNRNTQNRNSKHIYCDGSYPHVQVVLLEITPSIKYVQQLSESCMIKSSTQKCQGEEKSINLT